MAREKVNCSKCGNDCSLQFFMCDRAEGQWCGECFEKTPCGRGKHGEGCPTGVFSSAADYDDTAPDDRPTSIGW